jgi:hypothetical protein
LPDQIEFSVAEVRAIADAAQGEDRAALLAGVERVRALLADLHKDPKSLSSKDIPSEFLKTVLEITGAERGVIGERTGCNQLRGGAVLPKSSRFGITRIVLQSLLQNGKFVYCTNAFGDPRFSSSRSIMRDRTGSLMAVPLAIEGQLVGYVYIDAIDRADAFRPVHLCVLAYAGEKLMQVMAELQSAQQHAKSDATPQPLDPKTEQQLIQDAGPGSGFFRANKREKRILAIAELGRKRSPAGLAEILAHMRDKDAMVAAACATALVEYGTYSTPKENAVQFCDRVFSEFAADDVPQLRVIAGVLKRVADENSLVRLELLQRLNSDQLSEKVRTTLAPLKDYFEKKSAIRSGETDASLPIDSRPKMPLMDFDSRRRSEQAHEDWIKSGRKGPAPGSQF